jgi:hypothetical protein
MDRQTVRTRGIAQSIMEDTSVLVVDEDRLPVIATQNDVLRLARNK